jgi:hypothetical protein
MIRYPEECKDDIFRKIEEALKPKEKPDENFKVTEGPNPGRLYTKRIPRQHLAQHLQTSNGD